MKSDLETGSHLSLQKQPHPLKLQQLPRELFNSERILNMVILNKYDDTGNLNKDHFGILVETLQFSSRNYPQELFPGTVNK